MKQLLTLSCAVVLALTLPVRGQDEPVAAAPLAGVIVHGETTGNAQPDHLRDILSQLDGFESFDDARSVSLLTRMLVEAASIPGSRVALLGIDDGSLIVAAKVPGSLASDDRGEHGVKSWEMDDETCLLYGHPDDEPSSEEVVASFKALERAFRAHRGTASSGIELMLDLENFRRAWPESLTDGPARRVVAVTGLANARKIHVHVPDTGPVRLAYSSRAEPADRVTVKLGPDPVGGADVGVRWPNVFDASLRLYAVTLEEDARQAFGQRFQAWMGENGNRLRGLIQAAEVGLDWSVQPAEDDAGEGGLRHEATIAIRQGINRQALIDAAAATLRSIGFEVDGKIATLELPETLAAALGAKTLIVEVDDSTDPAVYRVVIE